jgi:aspartate/methionine/tyrosine aminotransferase
LPELNANIDSVGRGFADFLASPPEGVIRFTVGQPDFVTSEAIREKAVEEIRAGNTFYTRSSGSPSLCRELSKWLDAQFNIDVDEEDIVITPGCKQALFYGFLGLGNPGDEVLLLAPAWPSYSSMINHLSMVPVHVPVNMDGFHPDFSALESAITERSKFIVINSPNNPTGAVYTEEEVESLVAFAVEHDLWILDDMIYATLAWGDSKYTSPTMFSGGAERTLTIGGWSKAWAMTGWRLGYIAGPANAMKAIHLCQSSIVSHVPTFLMPAAEFALGDDEQRLEMQNSFAKRRDVIQEELSSIPEIDYWKPEGAFYVMIDIKRTGMNSIEFSERALSEAKVQLIPCSLMPHGEGMCRISYATNIENIKEGCRRLRNWLSGL